MGAAVISGAQQEQQERQQQQQQQHRVEHKQEQQQRRCQTREHSAAVIKVERMPNVQDLDRGGSERRRAVSSEPGSRKEGIHVTRASRVDNFHRLLDNKHVERALQAFCKRTLSWENVAFVRQVSFKLLVYFC